MFLYDVTTNTFTELEDEADRLPFGTMLKFFNIDSQLYAVAYVDRLLK